MSNHNSTSSLEVTEYMGIVLEAFHIYLFSLCNHNKNLIASVSVHLSVRVKGKIQISQNNVNNGWGLYRLQSPHYVTFTPRHSTIFFQ